MTELTTNITKTEVDDTTVASKTTKGQEKEEKTSTKKQSKVKPRARTEIVKPNQDAPCKICGEGNELNEHMFMNHNVVPSYFKVKYMTEHITPYKCGFCNKYWAVSDEMDNPIFANKEVEKITKKSELTACTSVLSATTSCSRAYHTKCYHQLLKDGKIKSGRRRKR